MVILRGGSFLMSEVPYGVPMGWEVSYERGTPVRDGVVLTAGRGQHDLGGKAKNSESYWTLEDAELHITLTKLAKGVPWNSALEGHEPLDPVYPAPRSNKKMLEDFQHLSSNIFLNSGKFAIR